jgi:pyruvate/2-oxoglutarate dehydrogenase complex dihydrolipoamide acyltransferase (E2) component
MDPQFFGDMDVDAEPMLTYIEEARRTGGEHVTMTHLVGRAVAHGLATVPSIRVRIAHGRLYERPSADVFFIVATRGGRELTGVKVADADRKTAVEIAAELNHRYAAIEAGTRDDLDRGKALLARLPPRLLGAALSLGAWLTSDLNLDLTQLGMPRQAFGGAMVTSVGMWGIDHAYSPLAHYYRVPVLVLVGAVRKLPVVIDDAVVIRPMMTITATFDHRYVDGYHAAQFGEAVRSYCTDPAGCEVAARSGQLAGTAPLSPGAS